MDAETARKNLTAALATLFAGSRGATFMEAALDAALDSYRAAQGPSEQEFAWDNFVAIREARDEARGDVLRSAELARNA
jgi:hypothetical protein